MWNYSSHSLRSSRWLTRPGAGGWGGVRVGELPGGKEGKGGGGRRGDEEGKARRGFR